MKSISILILIVFITCGCKRQNNIRDHSSDAFDTPIPEYNIRNNSLRNHNRLLYSMYEDAFRHGACLALPEEANFYIPYIFSISDPQLTIDSIRYNPLSDTIYCINSYYEHGPIRSTILSSEDWIRLRDTDNASIYRMTPKSGISDSNPGDLINHILMWDKKSVRREITKYDISHQPYAYFSRLIIKDSRLIESDTFSINSAIHRYGLQCEKLNNYGTMDFIQRNNSHLCKLINGHFTGYNVNDSIFYETTGLKNPYKPLIFNKQFLDRHVRPPYYEQIDSFRYNYDVDTLYCINSMSADALGDWSMTLLCNDDIVICSSDSDSQRNMLVLSHADVHDRAAYIIPREDLKSWNVENMTDNIHHASDHPTVYVSRMIIRKGKIISEDHFSSSDIVHPIVQHD